MYPNGYGHGTLNGKTSYAHRMAYELFIGPIPEGLVLDHLCRERGCVNPRHLEPVTYLENCKRAPVHVVHRGIKTECCHGHGPQYVYFSKKGIRSCRRCDVVRSQAYQAKRKVALHGEG